ncbi:MAG TPA: hypothetical protein VEX86_18700 [Longimicrobium sp.]|nr:hypothetical protein [Longimicrobium sp.]
MHFRGAAGPHPAASRLSLSPTTGERDLGRFAPAANARRVASAVGEGLIALSFVRRVLQE